MSFKEWFNKCFVTKSQPVAVLPQTVPVPSTRAAWRKDHEDTREEIKEILQREFPIVAAAFAAKPAGADVDELWDEIWWTAVKRDLGLQDIQSLQAVDPVVFMKVELQFSENAIETYRCQRRVLALLDFDRFMEERDFGVYRALMDKRVRELADELNNVIDNSQAILRRLPAIGKIATVAQKMTDSQRECWKRNVANVKYETERLTESARLLREVLIDKESMAATINELRYVNREITNAWTSWQRRVKHGILAAAVAFLCLLAGIQLAGRWAIFDLIPMSDWLLANVWYLAAAGVFAYIAVRQCLEWRVYKLRKHFSLLDPESNSGADFATRTITRFIPNTVPLSAAKRGAI